MQPIVQTYSLSKQFDQVKAVDNLSFTVYKGDVYGFLGQNGAGKSTTIRMLLSLIKPTHGDIEIAGYNFKTQRKEILRRIGAVIEKPDMYEYLTALQNLKLFSRLSGLKHSATYLNELLETVGLLERANSKVKTFSQGMKQRLGIAIALVHDPQLLILDEPVNGLDPQGIADIRNLILHLSREKDKTLIISSHLLSEMQQIATRLLIIDKGKKLVEGKVTELFNPAETLVELHTTNDDVTLKLLQASSWNIHLQQRRSDGIFLKMQNNSINQLISWLVQNNVAVLSVQSRHSLEDYFLQITSGKQHVAAFTN